MEIEQLFSNSLLDSEVVKFYLWVKRRFPYKDDEENPYTIMYGYHKKNKKLWDCALEQFEKGFLFMYFK